MFKRNFEQYDMETTFMRMLEDRISGLTDMGIAFSKGDCLRIGFDENEKKLIVQLPDNKMARSEFCTTCGSIGVLHFEEEGSINFHRCLRCLAQFDDCAISAKTEARERLLNS